MVIEQGWAIQEPLQDKDEEMTEATPLDISGTLGTDFVLLPTAEMRYTYQDPALSTDQLHDWSDTATYANTVGPRQTMDVNKGKMRHKPEAAEATPNLQSPIDVRAWDSQMTFRLRQQLSGPWIRIPTESRKRWPVAFASDPAALEAQIGVVVTKDVERFDLICDWEGTSTHGASLPTCFDPEHIYDVQTATTDWMDSAMDHGLVIHYFLISTMQCMCGFQNSRAMSPSYYAIFLRAWESLHLKDTCTGNIIARRCARLSSSTKHLNWTFAL
jgi:hypothetical protein